ncbi:MAG TPA: carboxypeptidase regulatory-like domain-containing protein [Candidatus Saccharimonadales bacterium]|nr:carboxypeptidase regulatory-like domain-containing protein [Candidatus Saccharimonadales bacterium]
MRRKSVLSYLSFFITILSAFFIFFIVVPQSAFAVTGQVLNQNGQNVTGATITMDYNGTITTATTNASGYAFGDPCPFAQNGQPGSAPYTLTLTVPNGYWATTSTTANATSTRGEFQQNGTGCGQMMVNGVWKHYPTSSTPDPINFGVTSVAPNCTTTPINCSACTAPANTCSNGNGTQTCTFSQPATCTQVSTSQSCTLNNCNAGSSCVSQVCQVNTFSISGNVSDANNANVPNVTVSAGGKTATTDTSGNYTIAGLVPASYTVTMTVPAGYIANGATSQAVTLNANKTGVNFKLARPNCTTTPINCSACAAPANTCSNGNGTQTCTLSQPATCNSVVVSQSCTLNNCNAGSSCVSQVCQVNTFSISGNVSDSNNANVANVTVTAGGKTATTDTSGNYTIAGLVPASYTVTMTVPAGYIANGATSQAVTLNADKTGVNFKLARPNCTTTPINCSACAAPANTCSNGNGTQTCTLSQPATCTQVSTSQSCTLNNCNAGSSCVSQVCQVNTFSISGNVSDETGTNAPNVTVSAGGKSDTTDTSGNYTIAGLVPANYTVTMTVPAGYIANGATSQAVTLNANKTGVNFKLTKVYQISGNVFNDSNKNGIQDGTESIYGTTPSITSNQGTVTTNANGTYAISNIPAGSVTVAYTSLPATYYVTSPLNGPPPSFTVTIGTAGCTVNGAPGAVCTAGNITALNFGITNTHPWTQSTCGDMRNDNGINDNLPAGQSALISSSSCAGPGLAFTGNTNANFGSGQASSTNQIVGGASYPELYSGSSSQLETSYPSLLAKEQNAGLTVTDLSTVCNLTSCTLPGTLAHGIYVASTNVTLNAFNVPANQDYVFLINGNLTIQGAISVPVGSTALFSAKGNITVTPTVGSAATVTTSSLAGWFVAGQSFILPTAGNCTDLRLNIAGSIVVNALGTGGTFQNSRDLCGGDTANPTVSFLQRLDMILNAPQFLEQQKILTSEANP